MTMSKREFLSRAGLEVQALDIWLEQHWLIPDQTSAGMNFFEMDVARAHLIRDLKAAGMEDLHVHDLRHHFNVLREHRDG